LNPKIYATSTSKGESCCFFSKLRPNQVPLHSQITTKTTQQNSSQEKAKDHNQKKKTLNQNENKRSIHSQTKTVISQPEQNSKNQTVQHP